MTEDVYKYQFDGDNWSLEIPPSTDNIKDYKTMVEESHTFNSVLDLLQNANSKNFGHMVQFRTEFHHFLGMTAT